MSNTSPTALILGATGGIGGAVAQRLLADGWKIKALHRNAAAQAQDGAHAGRIDWLQGDAMHRDDIAGARASGARILLPGTVYNYGPDAFPSLAVDAVQRPLTRKGAIRVALERRLELASRDGVRSLIVRAGDFFGPGTANNWFSQGLIKPGKEVRSARNPGQRGVGHQWAYLPDVAETMCRLVAMEQRLADFARFHMDGHWDADGAQMTAAIARVAGAASGRKVAIKPFQWWLMKALAPFVPTLYELQEMRYLWRQPLRMDNRRLLQTLGAEPHTPLDAAVRATLAGLGCLPHAASMPKTTATVKTI